MTSDRILGPADRLVPFVAGAATLLFLRTGFELLLPVTGSRSGPVLWILAVLLSGLALGSFLLPSRVRRPLAGTGWLQLGAGLHCALFPNLQHSLSSIAWLAPLLLLLFPAVLAGGLAAVWISRGRGPVLCLGAAAGILLSRFASPSLEVVMYLAAVLHLLAGAVALLSGRITREEAGAEPPPSRYPLRRPALAGLAGMMLLVCQWRWFVLSTLADSAGQASLFLVLLLGGALGMRLAPRGGCGTRGLILAGGAALISLLLMGEAAYAYVRLLDWLQHDAWPLLLLAGALVCLPVAGLPSLFLGRLLSGADGRQLSALFIGSLAGLLSTTLLLPLLGVPRTGALGASLLVAAGLWRLTGPRVRPLAGVALPLLALLLISLVHFAVHPVWRDRILTTPWKRQPLPADREEVAALAEGTVLLHHEEAVDATVSVRVHEPVGDRPLSLRIDDRVLSTTRQDRLPQVLAGHLPLLFHEGAGEVLLLGLDCGITAAAILLHPEVNRLDIVEPVAGVVSARVHFRDFHDDVLEDERVRLFEREARIHLREGGGRYDVIVHGLPDVRSGAWFAREHYRACAGNLRPGGILVQRVPLHEMDGAAFQVLFATLVSVFPQVSVWQSKPQEWILVASRQSLTVAPERAFSQPAVRGSLAGVGIGRPVTLLMLERIAPTPGTTLVPDGTPLHVERVPRLDRMALRGFLERRESPRLPDERHRVRPLLSLARYLGSHPLDEEDFRDLASFFRIHHIPEPRLVRSLLAEWIGRFPADPRARDLSSRLALHRSPREAEIGFLFRHREAILEEATTDPEPLRRYLLYLMDHYRFERSVFHLPSQETLRSLLEAAIEADAPHRRVYRLLLAELAWDAAEEERFEDLARRALRPGEEEGPVRFDIDHRAPGRILALLIESHWRRGDVMESWNLCRLALESGFLDPGAPHPELDRAWRRTHLSLQALQGEVPAASP